MKFLRGSDQFYREGSSGHIQSFNVSHQERNQQSLMYVSSGSQIGGQVHGQIGVQMSAQIHTQIPGQNMPPSPHHHQILRKSMERRDSERIMKKIMSVKEVVDIKPSFSFKKVPAMNKPSSMQCTPLTPSGPIGYTSVPNREGVISMRII